ncbi:zinc-dependent alcohol dehydrogenase family protein [Actinopolymorpha sp. B17G11]|uniref:zinc-dependent alcohol dehydrogenase family protein n=1 Tax=unclassified Actinopolymorpha TaxID=2627063 RepID=UPI0032D8F13F
MRAVWYDEFGASPEVREVPDPTPGPDDAVIQVAATGVCRSDWHAWQGHDPDVALPHVGGHELAGTVAAVGASVRRWRVGQRVTVPFVCACGTCAECAAGNQQVCRHQSQPGFTHWGSFADLVRIEHADVNLVALPDSLALAVGACLGCRFGTAFRAVLRQGRVTGGDWVAVHGCGGAGLSAVMIAVAAGARVVAVDVSPAALALARELGAVATVDAARDAVTEEDVAREDVAREGVVGEDVAAAVREATEGGPDVSLDCLGIRETCTASILGLRRRGRHVQVGLMPLGPAGIPMDRVIAYELEILGSHGLPAHDYPAMLALIEAGQVRPERLVGRRIDLAGIPSALAAMGSGAPQTPGITVAQLLP